MLRTALLLAILAGVAHAEPGVCHIADVELKPQKRLDLRAARQMAPQIVVWIEDTAGNYIDTAFITQSVGTYGLGNRPGRYDFNSAPGWPYGRRITTFPIWSTKKPERFDTVKFQDEAESNLSHAFNQSTPEPFFCRPMDPTVTPENPDREIYDALTCASPQAIFTDKGKLVGEESKYPPRQDMSRVPGKDSADVDMYRDLDPYDVISRATPPVNELARIGWQLPIDKPPGDYVMWIEVSTEYDHNDAYSATRFPAPNISSFVAYGEPYRGQPSLVWRVPFTLGSDPTTSSATNYAGYGDPDGDDGTVHAPDGTITTDLVGSGEQRLALVTDASGAFRVRVTTRVELDVVLPNAPRDLDATVLRARSATLSFIAPGDDAVAGTVRTYEIRRRIGDLPFTEDNFADAFTVPSSIVPVPAGEVQELELDRLLPLTQYTVGIRAIDDCGNAGPIASLTFTTPERTIGEVDACFIATAAYGSPLAVEVDRLRELRDGLLRKTVLGELFVESYYTFGPPVAGVVGESELLRATARTALRPIVDFARRGARHSQ